MKSYENRDFIVLSIFWQKALRFLRLSHLVLISYHRLAILLSRLTRSSHIQILLFQNFLHELFLVKYSDQFSRLTLSSIQKQVFWRFISKDKL